MAAKTTKTRRASWERAFNRYQEIRLTFATTEAQPHELQKIGDELAKQVDNLLELPAPSIAAVIQKLYLLWEADLEKPDRDAAEKAQIIEDLQDLAIEVGEAIGLEFEPQITV